MATTVTVWPENHQAFDLFNAMSTQWRMSMSGPTGLDYGVIPQMWVLLQITEPDRDDAFQCLRVMEMAALKQITHNSKT